MRQIWIISNRELKSFFDSLMAYILVFLFIGFTGILTWVVPRSNIIELGQADLRQFFHYASWTLMVFIPAITMRMVAEEKRSGTIELLLTKPVSDWQFITGKFLASLIMIALVLVLTFVYYITVASIGPVDHGEVWTGYLGLLLLSSAYISIGIMFSTLTNNQVEAFLFSLFTGIIFHWVFNVLSFRMSGIIGEIINYLSITTHFSSITRGVVDSKDIIFFLSIAFIGLVISESVLSKRNVGK